MRQMRLMRPMTWRRCLIRPIRRIPTPLLSPQRPDRTRGDATVERGAHGNIHIGVEGRFDGDVEAAVAEG